MYYMTTKYADCTLTCISLTEVGHSLPWDISLPFRSLSELSYTSGYRQGSGSSFWET